MLSRGLLTAALPLLAVTAAQAQSPFGFRPGMTKQQIIALVGVNAVDKQNGDADTLVLTTAPKPHSSFGLYMLLISPDVGLVKVAAFTEPIQTNGFGVAVQDMFGEVKEALTKAYGRNEKSYDYLRTGSIWTEPQDWMAGLLKKERTLQAFWVSGLPGKIQSIMLNALATSVEAGSIGVSFEFEGFDKYVDSKKAKADSVFK